MTDCNECDNFKAKERPNLQRMAIRVKDHCGITQALYGPFALKDVASITVEVVE